MFNPKSWQSLFSFLLVIYAVAVSVHAASGIYDTQPWTLNNDHLIPFDHLRLLASEPGIGPSDLVLARIPSLFPDYLIAALTHLFYSDWNTQLSLYWHLSIGLCVAVMLTLASNLGKISSTRPIFFVFLSACIFGFLCLLYPAYREIVFYSGFPIYHGGNFINVSLSFIWMLHRLAPSADGGTTHNLALSNRFGNILFYVFIFIASFSSRLYVAQFVVPVCAICLVTKLLRKNAPSANFSLDVGNLGLSIWSILSSSLLGYLAYLLSVHQCTDVGVTASLAVFFGHVNRLNSGGLVLVACIAGLLVSIRSLTCLFRRTSNSRLTNRLRIRSSLASIFLVLSLVITSLVFFLATIDSWAGYGRYLVTAAYWLPLLLSLSIQEGFHAFARNTSNPYVWTNTSRAPTILSQKSRLMSRVFLSVLLFTSLVVSIFSFWLSIVDRSRTLKAIHPYPIQWMQDVLRANGLEGSLGYVTDPPFESRAITALTDGSVRSLSISTDGNPMLFPHSRQEYLKSGVRLTDSLSPAPYDVLAPSWVLASSFNTDRLFQKFGKPTRILDCIDKNACIYMFSSPLVRQSVSTFLSTWKGDQYRCIDNRSHLGRVLARAKGAFGRQ